MIPPPPRFKRKISITFHISKLSIAQFECSVCTTSLETLQEFFLIPSKYSALSVSSCQLLAKECALSTGKLPRRLAQEQCG